MSETDHLFNIKSIIEKKQGITHLREYFSDYTINPSDYNDFKNLIIYAIDNEASNEIVTFLLDQKQDKDANFEIERKTPLLSAVIKDNYILADILIDKYKADINYTYIGYYSKVKKYEIAEFLYYYYNKNNNLTDKKLKYIIEKGCKITDQILCELIRKKDNKLYKLIYTYRKFKNDDIVKLLNLYKEYKEKKNRYQMMIFIN